MSVKSDTTNTHRTLFHCTSVANHKQGPIEANTKPSARHTYTSEQLKEICSHTKPTSLTSLPFGTIRTIYELRLKNRTRKNRNRKSKKAAHDRVDTQNLRQIATTNENNDEIVKKHQVINSKC